MDTMDMRTGIEAEVQKRRLVAVEMGAHQQGWELKPCIWARPPEEKGERWAWPGQHLRMRRGEAHQSQTQRAHPGGIIYEAD